MFIYHDDEYVWKPYFKKLNSSFLSIPGLHMFGKADSLVDMGITPHVPTQNRTCAINAYGFSPYISYIICKTNLL